MQLLTGRMHQRNRVLARKSAPWPIDQHRPLWRAGVASTLDGPAKSIDVGRRNEMRTEGNTCASSPEDLLTANEPDERDSLTRKPFRSSIQLWMPVRLVRVAALANAGNDPTREPNERDFARLRNLAE